MKLLGKKKIGENVCELKQGKEFLESKLKHNLWAPKSWCFWTVVLEKTLESPLDCKEIQPVHSKGDQSWVFFGRNDDEAETPVLWPPHAKSWPHWKRPWCWERLGAGGEGDDRGLDGWMASPTRWTWVWVNSRSWWWTERPGALFMGSQRVRHDWATELNWNESIITIRFAHYHINFFFLTQGAKTFCVFHDLHTLTSSFC